jgi:hypothetical protein
MFITNGPLTINRARNSPIGTPPGTMQWLAPVGLSWIGGGRLQPGRTWRLEVADEFEDTLYVIHVRTESKP